MVVSVYLTMSRPAKGVELFGLSIVVRHLGGAGCQALRPLFDSSAVLQLYACATHLSLSATGVYPLAQVAIEQCAIFSAACCSFVRQCATKHLQRQHLEVGLRASAEMPTQHSSKKPFKTRHFLVAAMQSGLHPPSVQY
jgi:hypothetical protein|mmetsp:Transcript_26122/g.44458  ORF Transcript_26122/g.44458 Transcript_26122/m.44458 type:complete len:139 (+) Transcript_26122:1364-1780(+)